MGPAALDPTRAPGQQRPDAAQAVAPDPFGIMILLGTERSGLLA
jgi:hypothetical protein